MRRVLPAAVALLAATTVSALPIQSTSAVSSTTTARAAAEPVKTPFLMGSYGYGTRVRGASIPAGSSETGYEVMGCNRIANKAKSNFIASVEVPGLGTVNGVRTRVWTEKVGDRTTSMARHTIAGIDLVDTPLGSLSIGAIESESEAFNRGGPEGTYGSRVTASIAKIVFTPPGGAPMAVDIPAPGSPVTIPGLAVISIGKSVTDKGVDFAEARGTAVRISVIPTETDVVVAQTGASLMLARTRGLFNGYGAGIEARIIGEAGRVGRNAYQPIPCIGTDGADVVKRLASADLSPLATTGDLTGGVNADKTATGATASATGTVANALLGDGGLEISAVRGIANVRRTSSGALQANSRGSQVGEIVADGMTYNLDEFGELEIPGVAKLEGRVVERLRNGLKVIGLRVTLLDGSLGVVDLGVALAKIRPTRK